MMSDARADEVWVLGATGRVGRALTSRLSSRRLGGVVLVGRSEDALHRLAQSLSGDVRVRALAEFDAIAAAVRRERPRVVVNLLGSYGVTAPAIARACMPGGAYVDLANDLKALEALASMSDEAEREGSTLISGSGFGVLGAEAVVAHLCEGRSTPVAVRVDVLGSFASEEGALGEAFAQAAVDVIAMGGRRYRDGRLVPIRLASDLRHHLLPDGTTVASAAVPSGELFAAHKISGAPDVDVTSALAPTAPVTRAVLPLMTRLLRLPVLRRAMVRRMAVSRTSAAARPRPHSWAHAIVTWEDGTVREGWLRADDAMDYTVGILTAVTIALAAGGAPHGAFTPAAAFGVQIAIDAGGTFLDG